MLQGKHAGVATRFDIAQFEDTLRSNIQRFYSFVEEKRWREARRLSGRDSLLCVKIACLLLALCVVIQRGVAHIPAA